MTQLIILSGILCCQGEQNSKFLWFALQQAGVAVPSFSAVKRFQLPGLVPPQRVRNYASHIEVIVSDCHREKRPKINFDLLVDLIHEYDLSFRESSNYSIADTKSVNRFFIMNMHVEIIYTILQMLSGDRIVYKMPCSI